MNNRLYSRCVEISTALKPRKETGKNFITCFAIKKGKIQCIGHNDYSKAHNCNRFGEYVNWKGFETEYKPSVHAECQMLVRLGEESLEGYEILNVRVGNMGQVALSAPCFNCRRVLQSFRPKAIYYSDTNGECRELN